MQCWKTGWRACAGVAILACAQLAVAAYPDRPIKLVVPYTPGGSTDQVTRVTAAELEKALGQTIVFENRGGAAGMLGLRALASARNDGYTIGQIPISVTRFSQLGSVPIDPLKDLSYIARTSGQTFGIAVPVTSPWQTLADLVAHAKANPGKINYGSSGVGGATHVGMEEFALAAGA